MSVVYEAAVFAHDVSYRNLKGQEKTVELTFCLDPVELLRVISGLQLKESKSGNPAQRGPTMTESQQVTLLRDLASSAAGWPSVDGESWERMDDFADQLAGKAFMTELATSDSLRRNFAEKVIIKPFSDFTEFAMADSTNSKKEVEELVKTLDRVRSIFSPDTADLSFAERRAKLEAELKAMDTDES